MPATNYIHKSYILGTRKKHYTLEALGAFADTGVCYEAAFNLSFDANNHADKFSPGARGDRSTFSSYDFTKDINTGIVPTAVYVGEFQPLDIVIFAKRKKDQGANTNQVINQSHVMLCVYNEIFHGAHFFGTNNLHTLKEEVIYGGYRLSEKNPSCLFAFHHKSKLSDYLIDTDYIVLRIPWYEVHDFAIRRGFTC